jgi:CRISPR-associated protein Csm4
MRCWRVTLELGGPYGTPMTSGTLFGQLCLAAARLEGPAALKDLIGLARDGRLLLSDVLPADRLPRPVLPPAAMPTDKAARDRYKEEKRKGWVTRAAWLERRDRLAADRLSGNTLADGAAEVEHRHAHNTIDRQRGTTPDAGGLFFVDDWWPDETKGGQRRDLYVAGELAPERIRALLEEVGAHGHGRDTSYGRGRFKVAAIQAERELLAHDGPWRMSLGHGGLSANMKEPRYRLLTHYGKLGPEAAALGGRPWKLPVLLLRPGATWQAADAGPFGRLIEDHYQDAAALAFAPVLHAWHLAVPYREAS